MRERADHFSFYVFFYAQMRERESEMMYNKHMVNYRPRGDFLYNPLSPSFNSLSLSRSHHHRHHHRLFPYAFSFASLNSLLCSYLNICVNSLISQCRVIGRRGKTCICRFSVFFVAVSDAAAVAVVCENKKKKDKNKNRI